MKTILLVCSAGMSTSLLEKKMCQAAEKKGLELTIRAVSELEARNYTGEIDVLLLGPQVKYLLNTMKELMTGRSVAVGVIDSINYGMMDGKAVLEQALKMSER